jgi:starvation-inducible DNA-binding protein
MIISPHKYIITNSKKMKANIGIPEQEVEKIVTFLNTLLADEYALYTKTRNAHWNVNGPNFYELHKFFETQYEALDVIIDDIAERVRVLGHFALGSLKDFLSVTHMGEENHDFSNPNQILRTLANDHETIIRIIRNEIAPISEQYKDLGTADFATGLMEKHEKMSWMLRAFLS